MRAFFTFLFDRGSYLSLVIIFILGALSGLSGAALIAVISRVFSDSNTLIHADIMRYVMILIGLVLAVLTLDLCAKSYLLKYCVSRHRELHITFFRIVLNDSLRHVEQIGIARLITIYAEDMSVIGSALNNLANVGISLFVVLGCLAYLSTISLSVLGLTLLIGLSTTLGYRWIHKKSTLLASEAFVFRDRHVVQFRDMVSGLSQLKLNYRKRQHYIDIEYLPTVYEHERKHIKSMFMHLFANAWVQMNFFLIMILILLFIVIFDFDPKILGPFLVIALFMRAHIAGLISAIPAWARAGVVLQRMHEEGYRDLHQARSLVQPESIFGSANDSFTISVEALEWRYKSEVDDGTFTVGPLSLTVNSGEIVFIVGNNGSGKTTFAKLLTGLYEAESGLLRYNGTIINSKNRTSYNELFSMLYSDPFVFEHLTTAEENKEYGLQNALVEKRIAYYLEKLQLHHKVTIKDKRLSNTHLSTGQKKRLALLAAYLEDKPVIILDEWAENQDPAFKEVFYNELLGELKALGKLVIVISHEAQFYGVADRVITLSASNDSVTGVET